ncbi:Tfp pilus assembly protein FimV-like protein [Salinisphaera shabanensis E1L3A]|uniref:Tfp pilus assembly protein FimV-like protein n=1 Tax=Salinisphaera shabanensis E1L3A TaxID=1033802 RepID=U2E4V5_9GAMM|nr:Tfp pilus assembly protein FimV-like protein [Salinisphaera shabanensis E1L3A]
MAESRHARRPAHSSSSGRRMRGSNPGGYAGAVVDSKSYLRRRLQGAAVAALLCNAGVASALGFGAIRVHSALNEPLDATINLVALTPAEKTALQVDMASVDMFRRFGIERTALADRIRIVASPGNESSQVLLRLTTDAPVREPFLRFLIEADTGSGRALREYTVLLDPPGRAPATPRPRTRRRRWHSRLRPRASVLPVTPAPRKRHRQPPAVEMSRVPIVMARYRPVKRFRALPRDYDGRAPRWTRCRSRFIAITRRHSATT